MELLGLLGLAIDVEGEALLRAVGQPLVEAEAIALGLGDLLAILVEEHLVVEAFGRPGAEDAAIFDDWVTESIRSLPAIS